jgi:hypothetical protein
MVELQNVEKARRLLILLSFFLVLLGQTMLYALPVQNQVVIPVPIYISLIGVIIFIVSRMVRPSRIVDCLFSKLPYNKSIAWIAAAICLSILSVVAMSVLQNSSRTNYIPVITFWLLGVCCYVAAFINNDSGHRLKNWIKLNYIELLILVAITGFAAALRFYQLGTLPRVINGDEGWLGVTAQSSSSGLLANPFALWENFGALYLQVVNFFIKLLGPTPFALRLAPTIGGILAIPAIYFLSRHIAGRRVAVITAILLAISHAHINFSRSVAVGYIQGTWLIPTELFFLITGIEKRSFWRSAIAGALLAFHFSVYLSAQIVVGLVIAFTLITFLLFRNWLRPALRQVGVFWGGFLITIAPEAIYAMRHPLDFFNRVNIDGTFQSGWMAQEVSRTGLSVVEILVGRVAHTFLSLIYYPALDFYGTDLSPLSLITSALFLIGLGSILWRVRSPGFLLLNGYFWIFTLGFGLFAIPPSADTYRMLSVLPAAYLIASIGFDRILDFLGLGWQRSPNSYAAVSTIMLLSLLLFNTSAYYIDFVGNCKYGGDSRTRFASYLGKFAGEVAPDDRIYLLSDGNYSYGTHLSVDFLSGSHPVINIYDPIPSIDLTPGDFIVASPDRIQELKAWARIQPGMEVVSQYDCKKPILAGVKVP